MPTKPFTFRCDARLHRRMKEYRRQHGVTMADLCRRALELYLKDAGIHEGRIQKVSEGDATADSERDSVASANPARATPKRNDESSGVGNEADSAKSGDGGMGNADEATADEPEYWWE